MTSFSDGTVHIYPGTAETAGGAAAWLTRLAVASTGEFSICLSGGSTPRLLYSLLATPPYSDALPWERIHWFWGDERFVPLTDSRSNYGMAWDALLSRVPVPHDNIHVVPVDAASPADAAQQYSSVLQGYYGRRYGLGGETGGSDSSRMLRNGYPLFNVTLLGLGDDGHTASLLPGNPALSERTAMTAAVIGAREEPRITLTYPALESSRHTAFLITGSGKQDILRRVRATGSLLPAAQLNTEGTLDIFTDSAAAGL